jgi:hypothetical protein
MNHKIQISLFISIFTGFAFIFIGVLVTVLESVYKVQLESQSYLNSLDAYSFDLESNVTYRAYTSKLNRYYNILYLHSYILKNINNIRINPNFTAAFSDFNQSEFGFYVENYFQYSPKELNKTQIYESLASSCIVTNENAYLIYPNGAINSYTNKYPNLCNVMDCIHTDWYASTISNGLYLSSVFKLNDTYAQMLCENLKILVICIEVRIDYSENLIITNPQELIWHTNMQLNLLESEFIKKNYPFASIEISEFKSNVLPFLNSSTGLIKYMNQGKV